MQNLNIIDQYKLAYQNSKRPQSHPKAARRIIAFNSESDLLKFESTNAQGNKVFLVTPSIFNSYEILTIGAPGDIITALSQHGDVYVLKWREVKNPDFDLTSYTKVVADVVLYLSNLCNTHIELVGHCLGGVFSLAAGIMQQEKVSSLILLTCPWDFSYMQNYRASYKMLDLDESILNKGYIPSIYLQILFFLLHPQSLDQKLDLYRLNQQTIEETKFFEIEAWQFSGHPIPKAAYDQLMAKFIDENILLNNLWNIDNWPIDPSLFKKRVMLVSGTRDKIVPFNSTRALGALLPDAVIKKYDTGHIGYLVGSKREKFLEELEEFVNLGS